MPVADAHHMRYDPYGGAQPLPTGLTDTEPETECIDSDVLGAPDSENDNMPDGEQVVVDKDGLEVRSEEDQPTTDDLAFIDDSDMTKAQASDASYRPSQSPDESTPPALKRLRLTDPVNERKRRKQAQCDREARHQARLKKQKRALQRAKRWVPRKRTRATLTSSPLKAIDMEAPTELDTES